jgi:acyl carrier protein
MNIDQHPALPSTGTTKPPTGDSDTTAIGQHIRTLEARVRDALVSVVGGSARHVATNAELRDSLDGYDSLAAVETITAIENTFGITVDVVEDDVRYWFASIERITQLVDERLEDLDGSPA